MYFSVFAYNTSKIKEIQTNMSILEVHLTSSYFIFVFKKLVKKLVRRKQKQSAPIQLYIIKMTGYIKSK